MADQTEQIPGLFFNSNAPNPATKIHPMEATSNNTPLLQPRLYGYVLPLANQGVNKIRKSS